MSKNLSQRFDALHEALKLDPGEHARAIAAHKRLDLILLGSGLVKATRLQGSFARKTMLPPLKDIDKIVELNDDLVAEFHVPGGPQLAMRRLQAVLEPKFQGAKFEVKRHALCIELPGDGFDFDAVPAFNSPDGSKWVAIADTEDDRWEPSSTYLLIDAVAERNQLCVGRFVHQVRMIKQAVRNANLDLPGLHIESFAYAAINSRLDHADAVAAALNTAATMIRGSYTDPTGTDFIDRRLTAEQRAKATTGLRLLADQANEAQRLSAEGREGAATHIWADIFGDAFPRLADEKGFLASLHAGAGLGHSGRPGSSSPTPPTRAWRP
ncbi:MAG: hypothetical protein F2681_15025 [Actinobacteria bacterium]|uniref:Unannotated protein n=1 Tax=freshwater metagenome TaxID=449393 RepID=A0A6J6AB55_9ZZZZ|nr:hypothetical protein [Actinomycetota bacterium]MSW78878.1 hypothetical protein [Actinomycetota bacterium]MSX94643.1 hypothetical protein [Actinomycetota bacterium]MSZ84446.1 hypothetical protein [Actinomycetota bacterium]MTB19440.1 hypothetical protein [Actinomycetota bacterium]